MTHRSRYAASLLVAACVASPNHASATDGAPPAAERPNFVIFYCDDMGYADIGPFGAPPERTPNLNRLAQEGVRFTDFHVAYAVCSPSRAALMTGCYPVRVGVPHNFGPRSKTGLAPEEVTIAEVVKQRGYRTACVGKWHLGHQRPFLPTSQGFDQYLGLPYSNDMWPRHPWQERYKFPPLPLMRGEEVVLPDVQPEDQVELTQRYTEFAIQFIKDSGRRPFLLYLPYAMPHVPLYVSEPFEDTTGHGLYSDVVAEIDHSVGAILGELERQGVDDNTLVVFTSDNGPWLLYGDHAGNARPLRAGKATVFEGGFRVPCLMRWPDRAPAGKVCQELATTMDLLPTIAGILDLPLPADRRIDGKNILPLIERPTREQTPHDHFFYYSAGRLRAVRSGDWKLVFPHASPAPEPGSGGEPGRPASEPIEHALFNLASDPSEKDNRIDERPQVAARLKELAEQARHDLGDGPRQGANTRKLGALGESPQQSGQ